MDAQTQLRKDINVIHSELSRMGIHSPKIDNATYSIEVNARAFMEDLGDEVDWKQLGLTKKEARICALLHTRLGKTVSRDAILDTLYFDNQEAEDRLVDPRKIVDVFICNLKKKLEGSLFDVDNDWGSGYRMVQKVDWTPYKLSPAETKLADTLHSRLGYDLSPEKLIAALYPQGYKGKNPRKTLQVMIHALRGKLVSAPFHIDHSQASGYRMSPAIPEPASTALNDLDIARIRRTVASAREEWNAQHG